VVGFADIYFFDAIDCAFGVSEIILGAVRHSQGTTEQHLSPQRSSFTPYITPVGNSKSNSSTRPVKHAFTVSLDLNL
jgi:hypothetical protein